MNKNYFLWLICIVGFILMLSGCSGGSKQNEAKPTADNTPIDMVFYSTSGDFDEKGFMEMFGNKIKEKFPHITPVFIPFGQETFIDKLVTAGNRIDVLYNSIGQTATTLLKYNMQLDLSDLIKKYNYVLKALEPSSVEIQRQIADGGIYGLPVTTSTLALYYNKDLFDRFGIAYPKERLSWEQLSDLTRKLSRNESGQKYMGFGLSFSHFTLLTPYSAPYIDPKTNRPLLTSEPFAKSFEAMTSMFKIPGNELTSVTKTYAKMLEMWEKDKTTAMFIALSGLHSRFTEAGLNWDYAPFPSFSDLKGVGPQNYPNYFYVTNMAQDKDQAFQVIAYLTSEEMQKSLSRKGQVSTLVNPAIHNEFGKDAAFLTGKNTKAIIPDKFAAPAIKTILQSFATTPVQNAFYEVVEGKKDLNSALRDAQDAANKAIDAELSK